VSGQSEEDAWRSIVENYGERAQVDPLSPDPAPPAPAEPPAPGWDEERFVPPPPPPLPHPPPARLAAWVGVFGAPLVLLVTLALGIHLPALLGHALLGSSLGGFGYLVTTMQRGPRDPGDDGARL
jgi:hypothetical protein